MLRMGIIGGGFSATGFHIPMAAAAGVEVVAVSTRDPQRSAQVRALAPGAEIVPGARELLDVRGLDLVAVASPSHLHVEHATAAVERGIPVLVDKPLAVDATSALGLIDAAEAAHVPLTVFQNRRYDPEFATLRRVFADQVVGEPWRLEMRWDRWRPVSDGGWREESTPERGGGLLLDLGAHLIDQAVVLGGPVTSVYAVLASRVAVAEDDVQLVCHHASGLVTYIESCGVEAAPGPRTRLRGSEGTYVLAAAGDEPTAFHDLDTRGRGGHGVAITARATQDRGSRGRMGGADPGDERTVVAPAGGPQADPDTFYRLLVEALGSGAGQRGMPVDPHDSLHVLAVIDAARASARTNQVVDVLTPGIGRVG